MGKNLKRGDVTLEVPTTDVDPRTATEWRELTDNDEILGALRNHLVKHFGQATETDF